MKKIIVVPALLLCIYMQAQNIGIGTADPLQTVDVKGKVYFRDSIGIGVLNPHAPLQFPNSVVNRKIVFWEVANNDHQFDGFGTTPDAMRYQVSAIILDHVFFAGVSPTGSRELFRIKGSGMIGAGVSNPISQFANTNQNIVGSDGLGVNDSSITWRMNLQGYTQSLFNASTIPGANGLAVKIAGTNLSNSLLDLSTTTNPSSPGLPVFTVKGNGNIGIGTNMPHSSLQFANITAPRKIVLFESGNNDHQFYGFGVGLTSIRYQVPASNADHVFYSGIDASSSLELVRIKGNGMVGIGTSTPHAPLQLGNISSNRKIILFEYADNDHQFYGFGINSSTLRYQVDNVSSDHIFYAGTSASTSLELLRIRGNGRIGAGISTPVSQLANTSANIGGSDGIGIGSKSISWAMNEQGYSQAIYNQANEFGANGLAVKIASASPYSNILDLSVGSSQTVPGTTIMAVQGDGNVAMSGNLHVTGTISKGGGSFKIDHPLDPANKYLYHSFVESPDMMNIYNGNVVTGSDGLITVDLPDYFEALNKEFRYQLTVIGDFAQAIVFKKINNNRFTIKTDKPNIEVSWQVTGIRHDPFAEKNRIPTTVEKPAEEKGYYLHPEARGLPASQSVSAIPVTNKQ